MSSRGDAAERHVPVLRDRIVDLLEPALAEPGSVCVDGTLGMGGHAEAILDRCPAARVIGLDRDEEALQLAGERLARFGDRFVGVHAVYDDIARVLDEHADGTASGILFDLGVSSLQLDEADRGFAYRHDAPLDMRMDQSQGITAADVLNTYGHGDLARILKTYGEERFAGRIASAIVREREKEPFTTSARLVEVLRAAVPAASQRSGGHPAKRTFQALRIEVNAELDVWERAVAAAIEVLAPGGRIAVLSYHSLEDRITKQAFAEGARSRTPHGMPVELPGARGLPAAAHPWGRGARRATSSTPTPGPRRPDCVPPNDWSPRREPPHEPARPRPDAHRARARAGPPRPLRGSSRSSHPPRSRATACSSRCASPCCSAGSSACSCSTPRWRRGRTRCATCSAGPTPWPTSRTRCGTRSTPCRAPVRSPSGPATSAWCPPRPRPSSGSPTARSSAWRRRPRPTTALAW